MRIAIVSSLDINQQGQYLSRYFNRHTEHECENYAVYRTYLGYPADHYIKPNEVNRIVEGQGFDFYIIRGFPLSSEWPDLTEHIRSWAQAGAISQRNCIIRLHGSEARYNPTRWKRLQDDYEFTFVTNGYDYSLSRHLGFSVQHLPPMIDWNMLDQIRSENQAWPDGDYYVIGHAPTDRSKKGTHYIQNAVSKLMDAGVKVKLELIEKSSWLDCIRRKAQCHAIYDQISGDVGIGTFGVNLLEGLAMGKTCFGGFNKYTYSFYPEIGDPRIVVPVTPGTIYNVIKNYAEGYLNSDRGGSLNLQAREFAYNEFDFRHVGERWRNLVEFIHEGAGDSRNSAA